MKLLYRFIGSALLWPFLFGVAAFTSIFFAGQHLLDLTKLVLQGLNAFTAIQLVLLYMPSVIVFTLPMSCLVAVLVTFSRMSMDSEIVALYASGISLYRAVIPVIALGLIVSALAFGMSEYVVPGSARLSKEIQARALKEELSSDKPFVFIDKGTQAIIYVGGGFDAATRTMHEVIVTQRNGINPTVIFQAENAQWKKGYDWKLSNGLMRKFQPDGSTVTIAFNGLDTEQVELHENPDDILRRQRKPEEMSFGELKHFIGQLDGSVPVKELLDMKVDLYNKLAIPFAALVFAFVAAPLAIQRQRGNPSVGVGFSVLIIFMYWFVWHFTTALAIQGSIPPIVGAFVADVLGLSLGVILLLRAAK